MGNDARLKDLTLIADALAEKALEPVKRASANVARIEAKISSVAHHRQQLYSSSGDPTIAPTMLDQAERLRHLQAQLMVNLAAARAELDMVRSKAARAVGRQNVLGRMITDRQKAAQIEKQRRKLRGDT